MAASARRPVHGLQAGALMGVAMTARLRTRCQCGAWVQPGQRILWDPDTRRTCGCAACKPEQTEQHPDPHVGIDRWRDV